MTVARRAAWLAVIGLGLIAGALIVVATTPDTDPHPRTVDLVTPVRTIP